MSCGVDCRFCWDPELLWLWRRLAAIAPVGALARELPYAKDVALNKQTNKKSPKWNLKVNYKGSVSSWYFLR